MGQGDTVEKQVPLWHRLDTEVQVLMTSLVFNSFCRVCIVYILLCQCTFIYNVALSTWIPLTILSIRTSFLLSTFCFKLLSLSTGVSLFSISLLYLLLILFMLLPARGPSETLQIQPEVDLMISIQLSEYVSQLLEAPQSSPSHHHFPIKLSMYTSALQCVCAI